MVRIINKILLKLKINALFLLEQKWGVKKPSDLYSVPKYILKKYLPKDAVIIDCGSHNGSDSIELARVFPKSKVHSFEPVPKLFESLKRNTRKYLNITCYQLALGNKNGLSKMYVSSGNSDASSSLLEPSGHLEDHPDVIFENIIYTNTSTLDKWAERYGIEKIDFLWLDMQGFEFAMLEASTRMLSTVKAIHTEVSIKESYEKSVLYDQLRKFLEEKGFEVVVEVIRDKADMGNVLFVSKELRK